MDKRPDRQKIEKCCTWMKGPKCAIYSCHFLASWSSRMWSFAMALFLASIPTESMRISATYGLSRGAAVLLLGSVIGHWVDRTARLRAATITMIGQNIFVSLSALIVLTLHIVQHDSGDLKVWIRYLVYAVIIALSVSSRLMKEGRIIVMERDWIAQMCLKDEHSLAVMTSTFRRIDLLTKMLAPIITGHTMTYAGTLTGCVAISIWSIVSLGVEYFLISRVYSIVPLLRHKKHSDRSYYYDHSTQTSIKQTETSAENKAQLLESSSMSNGVNKWKLCCEKMFSSFIAMYKGYHQYNKYDVKYAGLALAFLYLTVLGFDEITINYATDQHLSESVLGLLMGAGAALGIVATCTYPFIVKKIGLSRTGVLGLSLQISALCLCVISIWLSGSPFFLLETKEALNSSLPLNKKLTSSLLPEVSMTSAFLNNYTSNISHLTVTDASVSSLQTNYTTVSLPPKIESPLQIPDVSIWVMMAGVVLARFGLWTADLAIIQLFLEKINPMERGLINGFQDSLNQLMDFFKYGLVHVVHQTQHFGLLVIVSAGFISLAWVFMFFYGMKSKLSTDIENNVSSLDDDNTTSPAEVEDNVPRTTGL